MRWVHIGLILLMAASTVFSLPLIVLFFIAMKTFIRGISMTGIKG